jgi:hypothetical protein
VDSFSLDEAVPWLIGAESRPRAAAAPKIRRSLEQIGERGILRQYPCCSSFRPSRCAPQSVAAFPFGFHSGPHMDDPCYTQLIN